MTPYVLDRPAYSSLSKDESESSVVAVDMVSETETASVREGSIASREESSIISSSGRPKHAAAFKRVSFGSSKGSMVETVIFDNDVISPYRSKSCTPTIPAVISVREEHIPLTPPAKVRVTYYESQKPHFVTTPASSEFSFSLLTLNSSEDVQRYMSMNVGVDNPFRPEGKLSREAETFLKRVQAGNPGAASTPTDENAKKNAIVHIDMADTSTHMNQVQNSPPTTPAVVEIQHGIVIPPASPSNVEQVMIKKKPKCHCCIVL